MFKVDNGFLSKPLSEIKARISDLLKGGFSPITRDSETNAAEGTEVSGEVVNATLIKNEDTKQFFVSVRCKHESGKLFSLIVPADKYEAVQEGVNLQTVVRKDKNGIGRFNLLAVIAKAQPAPQVQTGF